MERTHEGAPAPPRPSLVNEGSKMVSLGKSSITEVALVMQEEQNAKMSGIILLTQSFESKDGNELKGNLDNADGSGSSSSPKEVHAVHNNRSKNKSISSTGDLEDKRKRSFEVATISGSADSLGKSDSSAKKSNPVKKLKMNAWLIMAISEIVLLALITVHLIQSNKYLYSIREANAIREIETIQLQFNQKVSVTAVDLNNFVSLPDLSNYLMSPSSQQYRAVYRLLSKTADIRELEFLTLLDASGTIKVSVNNNRSGESGWNPGNVIKSLKSFKKQVISTSVLTQQELEQENPAEYFKGARSYKAHQHMQQTGLDGLVLWIASAIFSTSGELIGFLVSGEILSGQTEILENSLDLLGHGFGGILFQNSSNKASVAAQYLIEEGSFDYSNFLGQSLMDNIALKATDSIQSEYVVFRGKKYISLYVRASTKLNSSLAASGIQQAIFFRGHPLEDVESVYLYVITVTFSFVGLGIIIDIVGVMISGK